MLHATMLTFLQKRLQDEVDDQFTSTTDLTYLLAVGISKLLAYIHDINPGAFIAQNTFSTVAGTDLYAKQASSMSVIRIEIQNSSGDYVELVQSNFNELMNTTLDTFEVGSARVADLGNKWFIKPAPDQVLTVRVWYVPIITDAAGWDAVATYIPPALHTLPIDFAVVEALGETADSAQPVRQRIEDGLAMIPMLYGRSNKQVAPMYMKPFSSSLS